MDLTTYLAPYNISPNSLSPQVKGALSKVLETAGYAAVQQLSVLLQGEAAKYTGAGTTASTAEQEAAAQKALDDYTAAQAELARKAKSRKTLYILLGIVGLAAAVGFGLIIHHKHKLRHG